MKHLLAAVGLVAVTATALHGQPQYGTTTTAPTITNPNANLTPQEKEKFWSVSGALRGFYDDNYTAIPKSQGPLRSFGVEVSPSLSLNWQPAETLVGASFVYDWKWYENQNEHDQTYQFNGKAIHNFSPRYRIEANDSFVVSSEPTVLDTAIITSPVKRTTEDNLRNRGGFVFAAELSPCLGTAFGYQNTLYDYKQTIGDMMFVNGLRGPSRSALLDRLEHLITLDLRWKVLPDTTGILGYQFQYRDFTSNEQLFEIDPALLLPPINDLPADIRNSYSHFLFIGADQSMGPNLRASVRLGAQYIDYSKLNSDRVSPYADANMTYTYLPGSYVQVGVRHEHAATDIIGNTAVIIADPHQIVKDQEATSFYAAVTHRFTPRLIGSILGQYQNSLYRDGGPGFNDDTENFFLVNVNLAFKINPYLLAETGYEYNDLDSPFDRAYSRNRVYIGLRGTY